MKLRWVLGTLLLLAAACAGVAWALWPEPPPTWRTVVVEKKDVRSTVSSTGLLEAVDTVEVGTQVSGRLAGVLVDFNDRVEQGQVLARLDTTVLEADVASAHASYSVAHAEREQADQTLTRLQGLSEAKAISQEELETAATARDVAVARERSAKVALDRAKANLGYATITAPIAGTIVRRDVDQGQTVNAGMSAPTLFLLAGDLAAMQILVNVDEADIGRIRQDQRVEFTVAAYPEAKFQGVVRQVRLQSSTVENVVTYTVVVAVDNTDGRLLPGMTATVDFIVEEAPEVLCVPNAALRFQPETEQITPASRPPEGGDAAKTAKSGGSGGSGGWAGRGGGRRGGGGGKGPRKLWIAGEDGLLTPLTVEAGLADSACTQISGEGVAEGLEVVAGVERTESSSGSSNPLRPTSTSDPRRPGGF
jgi:HlyD family secretion protein